MWTQEVRQTTAATPEAIWRRWTRVAEWPEQDSGMEAARLEGALAVGSKIIMKPNGAKETSVTIAVLDPTHYRFTCESKIPFGFLRIEHEVATHEPGKTEFLHRVSIKGPLTPILRKVFANDMVTALPTMLQNIARLAEADNGGR